MNWQFTPFVVIYFGAALVSAMVAIIARRRRTVPGAQALSGLMIGVTIWAICDGLESAFVPMQAKILLSKLSHVGIQSVPVLFLFFTIGYTQRQEWLTPRRIAALWVVPVLAVLLVFTNEWHRLIWRNIQPVSLPTGIELYFDHGPAFWVVAAYDYTLILIGTLLLFYTLLRQHDLYRRQAGVLVVAAIIPWIANIVYLSDLNPLPGLDWTSLAFVITGAMVGYAIFVLRLFDIVPVAHNTLIERMSDALLVTDQQNRIVDANPAARRLLAAEGELTGKPLTMVLTDAGVAPLLAAEQEIRSVLHLQNHVVHGMDTLCTPLFDDRGRLNGRLIVLRDISERLRMEDELRRGEEHYRSFLAMMSHELRTPLTGILGMAEAMQACVYGPLNERQARSLHVIEESGRHLAGIISDMLDLSRIQSGTLDLRYSVCTVQALCKASLVAVAHNVEQKQQTIRLDMEAPERLISVDVHRFEQILINLLRNAVKFTPEGGELGLAVTVTPAGDSLAFRVWDKGIGIEPSALEQLFQPFTQADERLSRTYGGAGLGLALVRRLVDLHGGSVEVQSTPGQGSSFIVFLPLRIDEPVQS
jgi:PAS domain S-box-containing protein